LYKGISSGLFGNILTNAVYFFAYKYWQNVILKFSENFKQGDIYFTLISSLLAAITCAIVTNPIWIVHTRMANSSDHSVIIKNLYSSLKIKWFPIIKLLTY